MGLVLNDEVIMTFYEAALEVLRRSGRPLHFKKITEVAIRDELLSHVGKTPEVIMNNRLEQEVKKQADGSVIRTRPGVFMLREDVLKRLNEEAEARAAEQVDEEEEFEEESEAEEEEEEVVEAREDDDSRRRRRRRRGGRGKSNGSDTEEKVEEPAEEAPKKSGRSSRSGRSKRSGRGRRGRGRRGGRGKSNGKSEESVDIEELENERFDSISEAAYAVLHANGRKPLEIEKLSGLVFGNKLIRFHTHDPEATLQSALVTDNQVRTKRGKRPLFAAYGGERWGLTEWGISDQGIENEKKIASLADDLRKEAVDQLGESLLDLKPEAFEMVVMTLLERLDYRDLKVSKRTSEGDVFFTADWRRGFSDMRVCIQIVGDEEEEIDAACVNDLRDTLEHYSATEGVIIHLGDVARDAVKASRNDDKAKVTVIDRRALVRLLVEEGIGVKTYNQPIVMVDNAFVDALKG